MWLSNSTTPTLAMGGKLVFTARPLPTVGTLAAMGAVRIASLRRWGGSG